MVAGEWLRHVREALAESCKSQVSVGQKTGRCQGEMRGMR
jgi:hypothetical protein